MKSIGVLKKLKNAFDRILSDSRFPEISEIKEPTIQDVFGVCCGPRLFSNALKLHGEDLSKESLEDYSESQDQTRP